MDTELVSVQTQKFYARVLEVLNTNKLPYLVGGTYALTFYTDIKRPTKDLDLFCTASDYQTILKTLTDQGYTCEITDARWLAKITKGKNFIDLIFGNINNMIPVEKEWFTHAPEKKLFDISVKLVPCEEMIFSKSFRGEREKYDGADVNHLLLKQGTTLNWQHLLSLMDAYWEILLSHLLIFRFIYPSERDLVPKSIMEELLSRAKQQLEMPTPKEKVSRGN